MNTEMLFNIFVFIIFTLLWLAFMGALIFRREMLINTWQRIRSLHLLVQLILWLLFLPVILGLWIWQTSWPFWLRLILVVSLAWWNVFVFFPR